MFRLSKWLRKSYRPAIEPNMRRTRWSDLSMPVESLAGFVSVACSATIEGSS